MLPQAEDFVKKVNAYYQQLAPNEQKLVRIGAVVVVGGLLFQFAWSAYFEGQKLERTLVKVSQQRHTLTTTIDQYDTLTKQPDTARKQVRLNALLAILKNEARRLKGETWLEQIRISNNAVVFNGAAEFNSWLKWAGLLHYEYGLKIETLRLINQPQPGYVAIKAKMTQADES